MLPTFSEISRMLPCSFWVKKIAVGLPGDGGSRFSREDKDPALARESTYSADIISNESTSAADIISYESTSSANIISKELFIIF